MLRFQIEILGGQTHPHVIGSQRNYIVSDDDAKNTRGLYFLPKFDSIYLRFKTFLNSKILNFNQIEMDIILSRKER